MATREQWLIKATKALGSLIERKTEQSVPEVRVSCGWPSRSVRKVIGQCWKPTATADGVGQVFISPLLDDPVEVLAVLIHELIHSIVHRTHPEVTNGHGKEFKAIAVAVGLEGKMTATVAGELLRAELTAIAAKLGEYPHAAIDLGANEKKQTTRMLKLEAIECCGYIARTTQKWLDDAGLPQCPHGSEMVRV